MITAKAPTACFLILSLAALVCVPPAPAQAFSLHALLGQALATDQSPASPLASSIGNLLLGLFLSKQLENGSQPITPVKEPTMTTSGRGAKELVGFYAEWWDEDTASYASFARHTDMVKTIAPFWATLHGDGSVSNRGGKDHAAVVRFAHQHGVAALLMVNNANQQGSRNSIHTVLSNPALRVAAIQHLEEYVAQYHLDGINIDFEAVPAEDRNKLSVFMQALCDSCKRKGYIVSMDVFPKTDESDDISRAYDYAALAQSVDKLILMTYDQHAAWSGAGPIADTAWVERSLIYALQFIPKNKLYLGVAGYGYDWSDKGVVSLEYQEVMNLARRHNAELKWQDKTNSPYFYYTGDDGISHAVWYENHESLKYKLNLVKQYDIAGAALWKLGEEDPQSWQVFHDRLIE